MRRGVRGRGGQKSITEKALVLGPSPPLPALLPISVSAQRSPSHKGLPCPYSPRRSLSIPWPRARLSDSLMSPHSLSSSTSPTQDVLVGGGFPAPSCTPTSDLGSWGQGPHLFAAAPLPLCRQAHSRAPTGRLAGVDLMLGLYLHPRFSLRTDHGLKCPQLLPSGSPVQNEGLWSRG